MTARLMNLHTLLIKNKGKSAPPPQYANHKEKQERVRAQEGYQRTLPDEEEDISTARENPEELESKVNSDQEEEEDGVSPTADYLGPPDLI